VLEVRLANDAAVTVGRAAIVGWREAVDADDAQAAA
jgi:hypothetical protein